MCNFHERIAQLSPEKRALLAEKLFQNRTAAAQTSIIPKRKIFSPCPPSFAQQRLWFLDRLDPGNTVYNVASAFRILGPLYVQALEKALQEIIRRHETLRTSFVVLDGEPVQEIVPSVNFSLFVADLQEISEPDRDAEARRRMNNEAEYSFDLSRGPLFRATLLTVGPEDHLLLLVIHHIISDAWSIGVLFRELSDLYVAFLSETPSSLPNLPIQYADFALWQREWLKGEVLEKQLIYWKTQLAGVSEGLNLPTDHSRPAIQSLRGAYQSCLLPVSLTEQLNTLSHQQNMTMFITLLSAFYVFLFRYTGQDDILVGTPIANRSRTECEPLIGFFLNTLVLRADLSGNPTFRDLLQRVRELCLEAYAHQELPFDRLIEELQPERDLARHPLFQVLFVYQPAATRTLELPEVTVRPFRLSRQTAKFDLTLFLRETPEGLRASIEYSTDLFEAATISHMLTHFQTLLQEMADHPEQRLSDLPILTDAERHQLIVEWNATRTVYPDLDFIDLFETQVKRTPDTVAAVFEEQQLTYHILNTKANQLAHYLQDRGVGPDVCVGICVERSFAMAIGVLGILKTGGAYVPLDPVYPEERLAFILSDSHILILLTQTAYVEKFSNFPGTIINLDRDWVNIAQQHDENPGHEITLDNLAYVIYTSGSTGTPKGVAMPRRTLSNLIFWQCKNTTASGKVFTLQFASLSFDVSFQELFSTWGSGGTLVLISEDLRRDPLALLHFLEVREIHRLFLPFVALQQLAEVAESLGLAPKSLQEVITAGEQLQTTPALMRLFTNLKAGMLINQYGPSESHVVTAFSLPPEINSWAALPPIGKPIANIRTYILDQFLNLVQVGGYGELYLGGNYLARGYLNRPDLTAERFIPDPFDEVPGSRLYKTGDQARYLADGNIEFLGRFDQQVKIRGFRIELGEVEAVLRQHPLVQDTVVLTSEDADHNKRLIAYVVAPHQAASQNNDLRSFLKQKLPEYMIPAVFVFLETFPLTPSGKVDRHALPQPETTRPELEEPFVSPQTPVEEVVAGIWAYVLELNRVGIHDNFFALGGHSLLATQVISRINETFRMTLPLRRLFETPTVAGVAEHIERIHQTEHGIPTFPIQRFSRSGSIPLSFAQQRLWFLDRFESEQSLYHLSGTYHLSGALHVAALEQSLAEIVRRHDILRTHFPLIEDQPEQVITPSPLFSLQISDLQHMTEAEREPEMRRRIQTKAGQVFDLSRGPLFRAELFKLRSEEHLLVLAMHHIISDGWSFGILFRELSMLYTAFVSGRPSPLAELPIQYADFAMWQRQMLQGETLERQRSYWNTQLEHVPVLDMPTDRPRPLRQSFRGSHQDVVISRPVTEVLKTMSRQAGVTLFMTLLAAFKVLLFRYTQHDDIVVGSPIANRHRADIEPLIGFFVNTLVLRTNLSGHPTFRDVLTRVREVCLGAYAHQDLPFERLVEELQPERDLARHPLFQIMFVLQNTPQVPLKLAEVSVRPMRGHSDIAKFDLTVFLRKTGDELNGTIEYNTDLFDKRTISRLVEHFHVLLADIVTDPDQQISALSILTEAEQQQLLVDWNATQSEYPREKCIHKLFEAQVVRNPEAIAVVYENQHVTYRKLNSKANQLAHYLKRHGVGPEIPVGICVEQSLEMLIGILGILKVGGAYVPLDPAYPEDRITFILSETQSPLVLTQKSLRRKFLSGDIDIICLDLDREKIATEPRNDMISHITPANLAYIIYTSGSTGAPKGVAVSHQAVNRLVSNSNYITLTFSDRVAQISTMTFDAATFEIWAPLLQGACLVGIHREVVLTPTRFAARLHEQGITAIFVTTALLNQLVQTVPNLFRTVRYVLFGGETVDPKWVQKILTQGAPEYLLHVYGPTESTTFTSWYPVQHVSEAITTIPIGRPISNTSIYILDQDLQPVPIGLPGDLYIGGDGLARGYFAQPELTAERFLPNPFNHESGARLYKTGDVARYLPDGNIEFLGRRDHQIKLRGFRIELDEIEAVLCQYSSVRAAVVVMREDNDLEKYLVAYCITGKKVQHTELRTYLSQKLPEYMIPSVFVTCEAFPLTPSGKVDRQALPAPDQDRPTLENTFVAPKNEVESQLVQIWEKLLGTHPIGITDSFFDLGGHSLLAVRLLTQVEKKFDTQIPIMTFFQTPTIRSLAEFLHQDDSGKIEKDASRTYKQPRSARHVLPFPFLNPLKLLFNSGVRDKQRKHKLERLIRRDMVRVMTRILPYSIGTWLVSWFCRQTWAQKRFYQSEIRLVRQVLTHIRSSKTEEEIIHQYLITNPWRGWRIAALSSLTSQQFSQWVTVSGSPFIQQSLQQGKGIILVGYHFVLIPLISQVLHRSGFMNISSIGGVHGSLRRMTASGEWDEPDLKASRVPLLSAQLYQSKRELEHGGITVISADAYLGGSEGLRFPFHGRWREFKTGFAELALMTGADILPFSISLKETGQVHVMISAPLDKGDPAADYQDRVKTLVRQYVNFLEERWVEDLGNLKIPHLKKYLALPDE